MNIGFVLVIFNTQLFLIIQMSLPLFFNACNLPVHLAAITIIFVAKLQV